MATAYYHMKITTQQSYGFGHIYYHNCQLHFTCTLSVTAYTALS